MIEAEYGFGAGTKARRGGLGVLSETERFALTDQGELAATVLRGYGISTLQEHIGVLAAETRRHSRKISEYDADAKPWVLRQQE